MRICHLLMISYRILFAIIRKESILQDVQIIAVLDHNNPQFDKISVMLKVSDFRANKYSE